jgi:hypothetical protein
MFRVVPPPIIGSAYNYLQHLLFVRPLLLSAAIAVAVAVTVAVTVTVAVAVTVTI